MKRSHRVIAWVFAVSALIACGGSNATPSGLPPGTESGPCFANGTCNAGLSCLSSTCVDAGTTDGGGGGGPDTSSDATASNDSSDATIDVVLRDDAGQLCPSAIITHPGTEGRAVGMAIPFVGRGRDATCAPISGAKLVWTDDREGQFGTGEMFDHKFTLTGPHTVTLTATDGQGNTFTATITFTLS